jgi:hypothetical protein
VTVTLPFALYVIVGALMLIVVAAAAPFTVCVSGVAVLSLPL